MRSTRRKKCTSFREAAAKISMKQTQAKKSWFWERGFAVKPFERRTGYEWEATEQEQ